MKENLKKNILNSILGILIATLLFLLNGTKIPYLDKHADTYFQQAITKASIAYATCRFINGAVSILKESDLQLEPAGVGISLAIGQILDPIDDMTERTSTILVTSIVSLGVQKIIYELSISFVFPVLIGCILILSLLTWFKNIPKIQKIHSTLLKVSIILIAGRLFLPIASSANESIYRLYFAPKITEKMNNLKINMTEFNKLKELSIPGSDNILESLKNKSNFIKDKTIAFKKAALQIIKKTKSIITNLLALGFLFVGYFIIQVIVIPLSSFWLLLKIINALLFYPDNAYLYNILPEKV